MHAPSNTGLGVGASLLRKEDDRHLRGRGQFVSDIKLPGTQEVVFLRSPHAHARIKVDLRPARGARAASSPRADLPRITPIRVVTQAAGAKSPAWPPLATDKVRYVGEAIAACVAPTRAEAEDLANAVIVDFEVLGGRRRRRAPCAAAPSPRARDTGATTSSSSGSFEGGDIEAAARAAEIVVTPRIPHEPAVAVAARRPRGARLSRPSARRGRGLRLDPDAAHDARRAWPRSSGIEERRIRVVAPDVGGGFGPKARLYPEEIILAALALEARPSGALDRGPQRASADRRAYPRPPLPGHRLCRPARHAPRHRCRDHRRCRRLWAVAARALPGSQHGGAQPAGAVHDRATTGRGPTPSRPTRRRSVPIAGSAAPAPALRSSGRSTRSPARSGATRSRCASRTWSGPTQMPFTSIAGMRYDSGDYAASVRLCAELLDLPRSPRAAAAGRAGRPADRHRLCQLHRADRARRRRIRRARRRDHPGLRELHRAHPDRRQRSC